MTVGAYGTSTEVAGYRFYKNWTGGDGFPAEHDYRMRQLWAYKGSDSLDTVNPVTGVVASSSPNYGYGFKDPLVMALWPNNEEIALLQKLIAKVKGHEFYAPVALAEVDKTVRMIRDVSGAVFAAISQTMRGNIPAAVRALASVPQGIGAYNKRTGEIRLPSKLIARDISGTWLALQYGWKPMLSDIYEGLKALETFAGPPRTANIRASQVYTTTLDLRLSNGYPPYLAKVRCRKEIRISAVEQLSQSRSLGFVPDPMSVIWERVPFSFVFDWFMPVGNYLQTLSEVQSMAYGQAYYTYSAEITGRCKVDTACGASNYQPHTPYCKAPYFTQVHLCDNVGEFHAFRLDRGKYTVAVPKPSWKTLDKAFSLGHLANAAALIHGGVASAKRW